MAVFGSLGRRTTRLLRISSIIFMTMFLSVVLWETGSRRQSSPNLAITEQFSLDLPGCMAIITGDVSGNKKELETLLTSRARKALLSPEFYLNLTHECPTYIELRGFITTPLSKEEKEFPIAYSIVIHEKVEMFERLLRSIYVPQNVYCVHVDQKSTEEFRKAVAAIADCFPNVFIASKSVNVVYASWSRVQADLNCMEDLLKSRVKWKYLLNTCGMDFPIKTNREIVQTLKSLNGRNSMETEQTIDYKKPRWQYHHEITDAIVRTDVTKSPPPIDSPMFSGNAYFIVSREFVTHVMRDKKAQRFMEWEKDTWSPDEHMWATFQRMPSVPGSVPANIKYDVSDMQALARVVKWSYLAGDVNKGAPYPHCTGTYRRAVCVYGAGDLLWLFRQHHLFANKFDPEVDDTAIRCLETVLRFRSLGHDPLAPFLSARL